MLQLNPTVNKVIIGTGAILWVLVISGVVLNQFILQKELTSQATFDSQVMRSSQKIFKVFVVTPTATPSSTPKLRVLGEMK